MKGVQPKLTELYTLKFDEEKYKESVIRGMAFYPIWELIERGMKESTIQMRELVILACEKSLIIEAGILSCEVFLF